MKEFLGLKMMLIDNKENNVSKMLLHYLDYLDYYIISHFLSNIYAIRFNPRSYMQVEQEMDLVVDFVLFYIGNVIQMIMRLIWLNTMH